MLFREKCALPSLFGRLASVSRMSLKLKRSPGRRTIFTFGPVTFSAPTTGARFHNELDSTFT